MAPPAKLTARLSAVTPLFMGGAEPNNYAELRPPSFKGLLRYWYRAIDGDYASPTGGGGRMREEAYFGSTEAGQAACLMRVDQWREGRDPWPRDEYRRFSQSVPERGGRSAPENGILYLGYSLTLGGNDRKSLPPLSFALEIQPRPACNTEAIRHAWLASLWLLVHIGGVGTRSRRGFGSLGVDGWEGWPECEQLTLPCAAGTPEEWKGRMEQGRKKLREWFVAQPQPDHTVVGSGARMALLPAGYSSWEEALNEAGLRYQRFRRKIPLAERTGFGLPLQGVEERMASPLFIRVLRLGKRYYAAFTAPPAPPPPTATHSWPRGVPPAVDRFLDSLEGALEVRL